MPPWFKELRNVMTFTFMSNTILIFASGTKEKKCCSDKSSNNLEKQTFGFRCSSAGAELQSAEPLRAVAVVVVDLDAILLHQLH